MVRLDLSGGEQGTAVLLDLLRAEVEEREGRCAGQVRILDFAEHVACRALWAQEAPMPEENIHCVIGLRLVKVRQGFSDLDQKAWAEKQGFQRSQYGSWERGFRRIPIEAAERLCDSYGLTLDYIYRGRLDGLSEDARNAIIRRNLPDEQRGRQPRPEHHYQRRAGKGQTTRR
ncbi:helix-turn-helix domain-containing protein [Tropicimonas sp. IMCC6043]|uniref:helix-turn-helix domain-containing protein n=1 Tax=Tropicimonas sp. IMCC6043 TaxID=2510645 RepID=UPI00101BD744|nr:helix-turn-helix transcriptional regulator [Tropicimonas sp. IMCC6043]RYH10425.1 XRE family transcriptional regulator [Tropicimonas sp. IMCC6043]